LVVAIPREVVSQYQEIANLVGLKLRFLESEVFALARSLAGNEGEKTKKVVGLIDIGTWSSTCSIVEQGVLKNSYSFNIAGNELTKVVDRSLNVKYNKAEELKKKYGLLPASAAPESLVKGTQAENLAGSVFPKILIPLTDSILREVKKVFRDFYRAEGKEIDEVILSGGTALMPGLREYFKEELKKEVVMADPFSHISYPPILAETLKNMGPTYGIAVGLALKGLE
jgi:type IV pilus assembly protein PilM